MSADWQPTFFEPAVPPVKRKRRKTADTSRDGLRNAQSRTPRQRLAVLNTLRSMGAMTRHELAAATGLPLSSVCGRVAELLEDGSISVLLHEGHRVRRNGRHVVIATRSFARAG